MKEDERFYLCHFLQCAGYRPENITFVPEHEQPPDFIIELDGQRIGIELTEFHSQAKGSREHPRRQIEEEWRKFQQDYLMPEVRKVPHLKTYNGLLFFKELNLPPRTEYNAFAQEIVDFSLNHCNLNKGEEKEFDSFGPEFSLMKEYLKKLHLENVGLEMTWEWNKNVASVGLKEEELITTVKPKIDGLNKPGWVNLSEKWLLVVSGHQLSQHMGGQLEYKLPNFMGLNSLLYKSGFDKMFIYQYMHDSIFIFENGWRFR